MDCLDGLDNGWFLSISGSCQSQEGLLLAGGCACSSALAGLAVQQEEDATLLGPVAVSKYFASMQYHDDGLGRG